MYHASGKPVFRTGSVIAPPPKVRVSLPYGHGVSATSYAHTDQNGMSRGAVQDILRGSRNQGKRSTKAPRVRVWREDNRAKERSIVGPIGNIE